MSHLYLKFGSSIPGQIATLHSFLTMCHDKEGSLLPRRTWDTGSILGGDQEGSSTMPPTPSSARVSKSKMAPCGVVEGQVGWWVPDTLWHVCTKSPVMPGFDSVRFVGEGLTWQVGRDANDHFLLHFLGPWKPKVGRWTLLKHSSLWKWMSGPSPDGLMVLWLTDLYDWTGRVHTNKPTRAKSTCLNSWRSGEKVQSDLFWLTQHHARKPVNPSLHYSLTYSQSALARYVINLNLLIRNSCKSIHLRHLEISKYFETIC